MRGISLGIGLIGAHRRDEEHLLLPEVAHEKRQQVLGRAVRPLDVLHDDHDRADPRQSLEDPENELEQPDLREPLVGRRTVSRGRIGP